MPYLCLFLSLSSPVLAGDEGDITWLKDGEDVDSDLVEILDETSSKLIIEKATMSDSGKYTCHCEFNSGHKDDTETQLFIYGM